MSETITIEQAIFHFLHTVPETWTDYDPATLSALQERALYLLTAAGMLERRVTLRLRMVGHPVAVEATITMTGEGGLAQAMGFVLTDIWSEWQEAFERHRSGDLKDQPFSHCERVGNEQWRLTAEGVSARNDLDAGNAATVYDFVLRRGFFSDQPRLMPGGHIGQRLPVAGRGSLERMRRVSGDAGPTGVAITNWEAGSQAFAAAFAELLKAKQTAENPAPTPADAETGQGGPVGPSGFLGGEALADALGVHPSRRDAFFKRLERERKNLGDDNWQEVANRRANTPLFQYRLDSPRLRELANDYKSPKPA